MFFEFKFKTIYFVRILRQTCKMLNKSGAYYRYEEFASPITVDPECAAAAGRKDIYCATEDIAALDRQERERLTDHKNAVTEARRTENIKRENERWDAIDGKDRAEQARNARLQEDPLIGKKNEGGCPYNIVNTQYHDTRSGLWFDKKIF